MSIYLDIVKLLVYIYRDCMFLMSPSTTYKLHLPTRRAAAS